MDIAYFFKKKYYLVYLLCFILFFLFTDRVSAVNDSDPLYARQNELKKMASNINYDYSYIEKNGTAIFTIRFVNVKSDLYLYDVTHNKNYYAGEDNTIIIDNFTPGKTYEFLVKDNNYSEDITMIQTYWDGEKFVDRVLVLGKNPVPPEQEISKIYVTIPSYNTFYKDPVCQGFENYKLCQKWYSHTLNHQQFVEEVNNAKKNKEPDPIKKEEKEENWTDFFRENWFLIIGGASVTILIILLVIIKHYKNKESFEGW